MKDSQVLREWVDETILKYYKQIGIDKLPKAAYSRDDIPAMIRNHELAKNYKKYAAVFFQSKGKKPHYILFNVGHHKSYRELEDTIVHEMIHLRFPHLQHDEEFNPSEDFYKRIGMVLQGKHYGRSRKKNHTHKHTHEHEECEHHHA